MNKSLGKQSNFLAEAQSALDDLGNGIVAKKQLSKHLNNPSKISTAYINLKTHTDKEFCIELTTKGYRVVGNRFDDNSQLSGIHYVSLQGLLTNESKSSVDSFAQSLQEKLLAVQKKLQQNPDYDDEDLH